MTTLASITKHGKTVILNGYLAGQMLNETFDNRQVSLLLDTETGDIQYANGYPPTYLKHHWGEESRTYRLPRYTVHDDKIIVSFAASHDLQIYSMDTKNYKYSYAGSDEIKQIKPFSVVKDIVSNDGKVFEWYMTSPSYEGIVYDKYRDVFYRIFRLPMREPYTPTIKYNSKPVGVIILDSQLNYVGETVLPEDKYSPYNVFIDENGLNMQVKDEEGDVERMKFAVLKLIKTKK